MTHETWIGMVTAWHPEHEAAEIRLDIGDLHVGDILHIAGDGVDVEETVESMELDHEAVQDAHAGQEVGVLLHHAVPAFADVFVKREP